MREAFRPSADFSKMARRSGLLIGLVQHEAFVDVNERGTEAAAATAVVALRTGAASGGAVFRADRPFVFVLRDLDSGLLLFIGRFSTPG